MSSHRYKIFQIIPSLAIGGAERLVGGLLTAFDREQFDLTLVVFYKDMQDDGIWLEKVKAAGIRIIDISQAKPPFPGGGIWRYLKILTAFLRLIRRERPDLIHSHLFGDCIARPAAMLNGSAIISTEHNINLTEPFAIFFLKRVSGWYLKATIAVSAAVRTYMIKRYHIKPERTFVIHNGIDISLFDKKEMPLKNEANKVFEIGAVGRLDPQKGFDVLIAALRRLSDNGTDFRCRIAGEGKQRPVLERLIKDHGLEARVKLIGIEKNIPSFLSELDCFVMPSRWEGFGIAALEAGAASLPVIASAVDGLREIINDKINGLLVMPGDTKALAEALQLLADNPSLRHSYGLALRQRIESNFSLTGIARSYEEIYRLVVNKKTYIHG